jgi:hypothetical protein
MIDGANRLADAAARKAAERQEMLTPKAKFRRRVRRLRDGCVAVGRAIARASAFVWRNLPAATRATFEFIGFCLALGFLGVITAWELNNSGLGWALIFSDWGSFAWVAGVAVAGWAVWSHRQSKEHGRDAEALKDESKDREARAARGRSRKWLVSSLMCAAVTLFGVFSNLVSHAAMDADLAIEVEEDRAVIRANVRRLDREYASMPKPSGVEYDRETLDNYIAEGVGWGLIDLDAEGACKADLPRPRQRELCKLAGDVRADLAYASEMQAALDDKMLEIKREKDRLAAMQPVSGAKHYQRMADLWNAFPNVPKATPGFIQTWGIFLLSVLGLIVCFLGWDSVGEKIESRRRPEPSNGGS